MKSVVYVTTRLELEHDEPLQKWQINENFISDMFYEFSSLTNEIYISDTEIIDSEVVELNLEE